MASLFGIVNSEIASNADLDPQKMRHRHRESISQTGAIVAGTYYVNVPRGNGSLKNVEAMITEAIATGADRTVTIDVKRGNAASAPVTVLGSTIVFNNASTLRLPSAGTINSGNHADNDFYQITVAVAGVAGAQATGLLITLEFEDPA